MSLKDRSILVTGADGFIGSHLVEALVSLGARTSAFVLYNSFNHCGWLDTLPPEIRSRLRIIAGDIRDPHAVKLALQDQEFVFHLAALIGIPFSYQAPQSYVETNICGTLNLLLAARDLGTRLVVQTSTSEVYGTARFVPITEAHPLQAQSPYSATKIAADQLALSFHRSFDLPVTIVRPFNTYGPRQSTRAVIPTIITQLAHGSSELALGSLAPTRDFTFVTDTVSGFIAVAESSGVVGEVFNLGSGFEVSVGDTARLVAELMGRQVRFKVEPERVRPEMSEVERLWACTAKVRALTGWKPLHEDVDGFRGGLLESIKWFTNPRNLARFTASGYSV